MMCVGVWAELSLLAGIQTTGFFKINSFIFALTGDSKSQQVAAVCAAISQRQAASELEKLKKTKCTQKFLVLDFFFFAAKT